MNNNEIIIQDFCEAWNSLNADLMIQHLSEDFVYDSQWVLESLDYEKYVQYIIQKFKAIEESNSKPEVSIVYDSHSEFPKMLKLNQQGNIAFYRIKIKEGKVIKGDLCMF